MFCSECGKELNPNANFCFNCGKSIDSKTKQLICQNCGGSMNFDISKNISFCPYCGSKELITESDYVKVEQIKNQRIENVEYNRTQSNIELEKQKLNYELEKKKIETKDSIVKCLIGVGISLTFPLLIILFFKLLLL